MEGTVYWVNRGDPHVNNSGSVMKTHLDPKAAANPVTLDERIAELQGRPLAYRAKTCAHPEIGASCVGAGTRTSCRARAAAFGFVQSRRLPAQNGHPLPRARSLTTACHRWAAVREQRHHARKCEP